MISDQNGEIIEAGSASPEANNLWWQYTSTIEHSAGNSTILVTANDLPGNEGRLEVSKEIT